MKTIIFALDGRKDLIDELSSMFISNRLPIEIGEVKTQVFADGEVEVDLETSVRGKRVYLITSPNDSNKIMQLNMAIDAAKRASAKEIIPIIPYFPYSRQDKKDHPRSSIGAKVFAEMLEFRGATSVITFDLHADQIQGFFNIPVIHMEGKYIFDDYIVANGDGNTVLCSPDAGGTKRVKAIRDRIKEKYDIDIPYVLIDKTRSGANVVDNMVLIGNVKGRNVVILDDMADTCGTLKKAAEKLMEEGAMSVSAVVTHAVFSGPALERIGESPLRHVVIANTLPFNKKEPEGPEVDVMLSYYMGQDKIIVVSIARQITNAMIAIHDDVSVEQLKHIS